MEEFNMIKTRKLIKETTIATPIDKSEVQPLEKTERPLSSHQATSLRDQIYKPLNIKSNQIVEVDHTKVEGLERNEEIFVRQILQEEYGDIKINEPNLTPSQTTQLIQKIRNELFYQSGSLYVKLREKLDNRQVFSFEQNDTRIRTMFRLQLRQAVSIMKIEKDIIEPFKKELEIKNSDTMDYMGNTYQQFPEVELMFKVGERNAHNKNNNKKSIFKELHADEEKMKEYRRKQDLERQKRKAAVIEKSRKRVNELKEVVRKELKELAGIKEEEEEEEVKEEIIKPKPPPTPKYTTKVVKDTNGFDLRRKKVLGRYNSQIKLVTFDKSCQSPRNPTVVKELFKQDKINQFPIVETLLKEIGTLQLEFFPQFTSVDTTKPLLFYAEPLLMKISSETEVVLAPRPPAITYDNLKFKHILFTTDHLCSCFNDTVIDHSNDKPLMLKNYELPKINDDDLDSFLLRRLAIAQNLKKQDEVIQPFDSKTLKPDPITPHELPKEENVNEFEESEMDKQADELIKQLMEGKKSTNPPIIIDENGNEIECESLEEDENDSEFIKEAKRRAKEKILTEKPNISPDFNQDGTPRTLANTDPKLLKKALEGMLTPVDMSVVRNKKNKNDNSDENEEENESKKKKKKPNGDGDVDFYENMPEDEDEDEYEYIEVDENGNEIEPSDNDQTTSNGFKKPPPVHWGEVNESDDIYANMPKEKKIVKRIKRKKINPVIKMEQKPKKKSFVKNDDSLITHITEIDAKVDTHRRTSFVSVKNDKGEMEEATIEFGVINSESFSDNGKSESNKNKEEEEEENNDDVIEQMKSIHDNDEEELKKLNENNKKQQQPVIQFNPDRYVKQKEKVSIVREYEKRDSNTATTKLPNISDINNLLNENEEVKDNSNQSPTQQQPFKRIVSKSRPLTRKNSPNKKRPATTEQEVPKLKTMDTNPLPTPPPQLLNKTAPPHIRRVNIKFNKPENNNNNNNQSPTNNNNKSKSPTIEPLTNEEIDKIKEELELRENQSIRMEYEKKKKIKDRLNGLFETLEMPLQSRLDFVVRYSHPPLQEHLEEVLYSMENIARYIVKRENALENLRKFESKHSDPRRFLGNNKQQQSGLEFIKEQKKRKTLETKLEYYTDKCYKILTDFAKVSKENITYKGEAYHEKMECDKTSMLYELEDERIEEFRKKMKDNAVAEPFANNEKIYLPDIAKYNRLATSPISLEEYKLLKPPDWKPPGRGSITGPLSSLRAHEPYAPPSSHISFREDSPSPSYCLYDVFWMNI